MSALLFGLHTLPDGNQTKTVSKSDDRCHDFAAFTCLSHGLDEAFVYFQCIEW